MADIAFLITNQYQIHHYAAIARHLPKATFVIEVRGRDFDVDEAFVKAHVPSARVEFVPMRSLDYLDGKFDVIVCQTPVLPQRIFQKTLVVAQQYSLSKETYQYGVWRSLADLNLMYGDYSVDRVDAFCHAVAVGNPLFDRWFDRDRRAPQSTGRAERGLYLPTYGSLSTIPLVAPHLAQLDCEITVKLHHAEDPELAALLPENCVVLGAGSDPVALYEAADFVISDMSGAAYDALYARRPLVLVSGTDSDGEDFHRLSVADVERRLLEPLAAVWSPGRPLDDAVADARDRLQPSNRLDRFVSELFVNHGRAGEQCAAAILELVENGRSESFARQQIRSRVAELTVRSHELAASNERLTRANDRLRSRAEQRVANARETLWRRVRPVIAGAPRVEAAAFRAKRSIDSTRQRVQSGRMARGRSSLVPTTDTDFDPDGYSVVPAERREQMAAIIDAALTDVDVAHGWDRSGVRPACAVLNEDKARLLEALALLDPAFEVRAFFGPALESTARAGDVVLHHIFRAQTLRIGVPLSHRNYSVTDAGCVDIVFVALVEDKHRVLGLDPLPTKIDWTVELGARAGLHVDLAAAADLPPSHSVREVDLVYTWVDSSDPEWARSHAEHAPPSDGAALASANNVERFIDRDELRYSLRSVWAYAPFVRNIYIVTADQHPAWLNELDDRVTVVPHSKIFPDQTMLPTFNSHAIEACIHRIPGLSEFFVYLNDDVFFGSEVTPGTFFTRSGQLRMRFDPTQYVYSGAPSPDAIPTDWAAFNATNLIARDFAMSFNRKSQHVGHPMSRSLMKEIEDRYPDEVEATRRARFRSSSDLAFPSMFVPYYSVASGKGVEAPTEQGCYVYADTGRKDIARRLDDIIRLEPTFFCLNVTKHNDVDLETQAVNVAGFLEGRFPFPSPFERRTDDVGEAS